MFSFSSIFTQTTEINTFILFVVIWLNKTGALYNKDTESLLHLLKYVIDYNFSHKTNLPGHKFTVTPVMVDGKDLLSNGKEPFLVEVTKHAGCE